MDLTRPLDGELVVAAASRAGRMVLITGFVARDVDVVREKWRAYHIRGCTAQQQGVVMRRAWKGQKDGESSYITMQQLICSFVCAVGASS